MDTNGWDARGARVMGHHNHAVEVESTDRLGRLWPREDEDTSAARLDAVAERMYR